MPGPGRGESRGWAGSGSSESPGAGLRQPRSELVLVSGTSPSHCAHQDPAQYSAQQISFFSSFCLVIIWVLWILGRVMNKAKLLYSTVRYFAGSFGFFADLEAPYTVIISWNCNNAWNIFFTDNVLPYSTDNNIALDIKDYVSLTLTVA